MNKTFKIPSYKQRRREHMIRKLAGEQQYKYCTQCPLLYVITDAFGKYKFLGCAVNGKQCYPTDFPLTEIETWEACDAPLYKLGLLFEGGHICINHKGRPAPTPTSRTVVKRAVANAHRHFDFSGEEPKLLNPRLPPFPTGTDT